MDRTLQGIAAAVEARLVALFDAAAADADAVFAGRPAPLLLERVRDLTLRGGKRFRAALVFAGARLVDPEADREPAVGDAAAALEILHTYFLIHDDIMDEDELRRGGPSVHAALARALGDAKLGRDLAILAGDLACALHERLVAGLAAAAERRARAAQLFARMHADVIVGQTLDLLGGAASEEVAAHKTASYTTVGPIAIGAALAGVAGGLYGMVSQLNPYIGATLTAKCFAIAIIGGLDSPLGVIVGGTVLGVVEAFTSLWLGSTFVDAVSFGLLVVVLVLRPTGLLGRTA